MSDNNVHLSKFPANECEALALLYIQSQDLSELTPEEIYDKYKETYDKIKKRKKETKKTETTYSFI